MAAGTGAATSSSFLFHIAHSSVACNTKVADRRRRDAVRAVRGRRRGDREAVADYMLTSAKAAIGFFVPLLPICFRSSTRMRKVDGTNSGTAVLRGGIARVTN